MGKKEYSQNYRKYVKYIESDEYIDGTPICYRGVEHQYQMSKCDLYFVDYLLDNGYDVKIKKMYNSKTIFEISKDGITEKYEILSQTVYSRMNSVCETFKGYFEKSKFIKEHLLEQIDGGSI